MARMSVLGSRPAIHMLPLRMFGRLDEIGAQTMVGRPRAKKDSSVRITEDEVPERFSDDFVDHWAVELKISAAGKSKFGAAVREAAHLYAQESRLPNQNELGKQIREEIRNLSDAAEDEKCGHVATLLEDISDRARSFLELRGSLPSADELRGHDRRTACATVARLCRKGGSAGRISRLSHTTPGEM